MPFPLYVFDAYGTLFDVRSAAARHEAAVGPMAERLSDLWRAKQLEYAWTRALSGRYRDFWSLTEEALDYAAARIGGVRPDVRERLLGAYRTLDAYEEVGEVLAALKARGAKTAILSNGSPDMLESAVESAGIGGALDAVISVDSLRTFKTSPQVYALVGERFRTAPGDVSYQSSNRWDVAGAAAFGFRVVWVKRTEAPDEYLDLAPERVIEDLRGLLTA